jgi:hypothetical protein
LRFRGRLAGKPTPFGLCGLLGVAELGHERAVQKAPQNRHRVYWAIRVIISSCEGGGCHGKAAAIYLRVSTDEQTTENQERALREVSARSGHEIVAVYRDEGISGAKGRDKRPGFDAMHKDASRRKFDIVMAWSVDRCLAAPVRNRRRSYPRLAVKKLSLTALSLRFRKWTGSVIASSSTLIFLLDRTTD